MNDRVGRAAVALGGDQNKVRMDWFIYWMPMGYPSAIKTEFEVCRVAKPPEENWEKYGIREGNRPPLIEKLCQVVQAHFARSGETDANV